MVRKSDSSGGTNLPNYEQYIRESLHTVIAGVKDGKYGEACKQLAELTDNLNYGGLYRATVNLHEKIGDYHDALKQADIESWAWHLCGVGTAYTTVGKFDKAFEALEKMGLLGDIACDEAKALYERAATIKARIGDKRGLAKLQNNLASMAIEDGQLDKAQALIDSSLMIKRRLRDSEGLGVAYGTLGNLAVARSDYRNARRYYSRALQIAKRHVDQEDIALSHLNLGNVLLECANIDESLQHYRDGLDIAERQGLTDTEGMLLQALAVAYNRIGCYEESFKHFCKLAQIKKRLSERFDEAMAYHDAAARGSEAMVDNLATWIVLLRDTHDSSYSREELYAAINTVLERMMPDVAPAIIEALDTAIKSFPVAK